MSAEREHLHRRRHAARVRPGRGARDRLAPAPGGRDARARRHRPASRRARRDRSRRGGDPRRGRRGRGLRRQRHRAERVVRGRSRSRSAREGGFDGFVGLGGGSSIDTAKIAALLATHPGGIYDYLNPPIGKGTPIPGPLLPLFGVPTTGGTGAEATTVAIIDLPEHHVKTGISHAYMRPLLGIVDPDLTLTTPRAVTASVGLDVLCHAIESYTAIAYDARPRAATPDGAAALPGRQPRLRRLERAGDQARGRRPAPRDGRRLRSRRAQRHGARGLGGRAARSGRPASTSRTPARTPSPGSSTSGSRPAIRARTASCRTASRSC